MTYRPQALGIGKRALGRYFTQANPFDLEPFRRWARRARLPDITILEPFAGSNNMIAMLENLGLCAQARSYDIAPAAKGIIRQDTIKDFPRGFRVAITNPPWLARNSATRRGLAFPPCEFDDVYKHCLDLCLKNCAYVAAIIPASFLQSGLFRNRLTHYILLHRTIFADTDNPVCLALFEPASQDVALYYDATPIGCLRDLEAHVPPPNDIRPLRFNDAKGKLGLLGADNTKEPTIRFVRGSDINPDQIKHTSRFNTRISGDFGDIASFIQRLNERLDDFRKQTKDVFLTPFKGLRDDGMYRRRMDYAMARKFIYAN